MIGIYFLCRTSLAVTKPVMHTTTFVAFEVRQNIDAISEGSLYRAIVSMWFTQRAQAGGTDLLVQLFLPLPNKL